MNDRLAEIARLLASRVPCDRIEAVKSGLLTPEQVLLALKDSNFYVRHEAKTKYNV